MSAEEVTFAMKMESNLQETAEGDASSLEKLRDAIQRDVEQLREMQKAFRNLKSSATAPAETLKSLKDQMAAQKATIAGNTEKLVGMKGAFEKLPKPAEATQTAFAKLLFGARDAKGPLAQLVEKLGGMKSILGAGAIAAGLAAAAAGMTAVAAAAASAAVALGLYAIAAADARRSDLLRLEGLSKHRNYWMEMVTGQRRAADSAGFLQTTIDRVASASPLARDRIGELTSELYKSGLRAGNLQRALEGMAIVEATQGQEAAQAFKARALGAAIYGTSIRKLSDDVKARLGGIARAQMLSLDVQQRKLKENISHLFDGVKIEPFLKGLSMLTELFSSSTVTGRALKTMVDKLLSPLIAQLEVVGPIGKRFFQGLVIGALLFAITVLKVRNALRDVFKGSGFLKDMDLGMAALYAGVGIATALAVAVTVVGAAFATMAGLVVAAGYAMYKLAEPFIYLMGKGAELAAWVIKTDWQVLGATITGGIAAGIKAGVGAVVDAMANLGSDAITAFKRRIRSNSPSKMAFEAAFTIPQGQRMALEAGRPMVRNGAERLAAASEEGLRAGNRNAMGAAAEQAPRATGAVTAAPRAQQARATSVSITFGDINVTGGGDPEAIKQAFREQLTEALEEIGIAMGAA